MFPPRRRFYIPRIRWIRLFAYSLIRWSLIRWSLVADRCSRFALQRSAFVDACMQEQRKLRAEPDVRRRITGGGNPRSAISDQRSAKSESA
jgi:hypothetical protein